MSEYMCICMCVFISSVCVCVCMFYSLYFCSVALNVVVKYGRGKERYRIRKIEKKLKRKGEWFINERYRISDQKIAYREQLKRITNE